MIDIEKSTGYWVMIFVVTTLVLFFLIYRLSTTFFEPALFQSCLLSVIGGFVLIYLFILTSDYIFTEEDEEPVFEESSSSSDIDKKVSQEEVARKDVDIGKEESKKKSSFLDKIRGKKTCENCGTELIYKEEMDSYYCPECHEYK